MCSSDVFLLKNLAKCSVTKPALTVINTSHIFIGEVKIEDTEIGIILFWGVGAISGGIAGFRC